MFKFDNGVRVRVRFYRSLAEWRKQDPDAHDAWGMTEAPDDPLVPIVIHLPMPCSEATIAHEAVHAACCNARFRKLRGYAREEQLAIDAGRLSGWLLRKWRKRA